MAFRYPVTSSDKNYVKRYNSFRGVDYAADPSQIDPCRASFAPNLISDDGGFPEKRCGFMTLLKLTDKINGIFCLRFENVNHYFAHAGTVLYKLNLKTPVSFTLLYAGLYNGKSSAFAFNKKLWILTGGKYMVVSIQNDEVVIENVEDLAYIPTTSISRNPQGSQGVPFEAFNMLSDYATNSFVGDGESLGYNLDSKNIDNAPLKITVDGRVLNEMEYSVIYEGGHVSFNVAPPRPEIIGQDNVFITYQKNVLGAKEKINKCNIVAQYGIGSDQRFFFSGNPDFPHCDWHTGSTMPTYVPITSFCSVGSDQSAIMGYLPVGNQLAVVKSDSGQDSSIYLRSSNKDDDGETIFPMMAGIKGIGAISKHAITSLRDDPLFLSQTGVFGIASVAITQEKTIQHRSRRVDPKLLKGKLDSYIAVEWENYLVICNGSDCFVADAREKTTYGDGYEYEWYHWTDIPATVFLRVGSWLYFGTADGRICCFKNYMLSAYKYCDDDKPIKCCWSTKFDDDGDFLIKKSIAKNGIGVVIRPYGYCNTNVFIKTDNNEPVLIGKYRSSKEYSYDETISYKTTPEIINLDYRGKGYKIAQIIVENNTIYEGFGVYQIVKRYIISASDIR